MAFCIQRIGYEDEQVGCLVGVFMLFAQIDQDEYKMCEHYMLCRKSFPYGEFKMIIKTLDELFIYCKVCGDPDLEDLPERLLEWAQESCVDFDGDDDSG